MATLMRSLNRLTKTKVKYGIRASVKCFQTSKTLSSPLPQGIKPIITDNIVRCPFPETFIPETSFPEYIFGNLEKHRRQTMFINGITGQKFTYEDILQQTNRTASYLLRKGFKPGDRVIMFSFNQPEYFVVWLAIIAAGGVSVDVNPTFKAKELKDVIDRTDPTFIFTHQDCAEIAKLVQAKTAKEIVVFGDSPGCVPFSQVLTDDGSLFKGPHPVGDPRKALAQLPGSSGTTGLPKLVCKSHYSLTAMALSAYNDHLLQNSLGDVGLLVLPLYHIFPLMMILLDTNVGAANVLLPKFTPETFLGCIQTHKVKTMPIVPPLVLFMLQHPLVPKYDLSSLKGIVSGAAPIATEVVTRMRDVFKLDFARQGYGMTEICPIAIGLNNGHEPGSVGYPVNQTEIKIVDVETGKTLGANQPGELVCRNPSSMMGYYQNPEATSLTLVDQDWVKTGDVGYYNEDGAMFIVDRIKDLIKYKGHQVAPAEIEAILLGHGMVNDVAVIGIPDERAGELTRAYVVLKAEAKGKVKEKELEDFVAMDTTVDKHLHGGVVFLDEIPKSPSGKVLKRDLRLKI